jgi:predicted PurR-regulated permease PerM
MKLQQIEEIATHKVPVWQPALLIVLLVLGFTVVPYIARQSEQKPEKITEQKGLTLGVNTLRDTVDQGVDQLKPYAQKIQRGVESVLGVAQQSAVDIATQSAQQAREYVFDNTVGKVLQSVQSLPNDQQDLIKKAICK